MKKLIALMAVFALLTGAFAVDSAFAAPKDKEPKEKSNNRDNENSNRDHDKQPNENDGGNAGVLICHYTGRIVLLNGVEFVWGKIIRVSESALEKHLAKGDEMAPDGAVAGTSCTKLVEADAGGDDNGDGDGDGDAPAGM